MPQSSFLPIRTASSRESIWRDLPQVSFRRSVTSLRNVTHVPGDPQIHSEHAWSSANPTKANKPYKLPLDLERRLANDLAYIAAIQKDVFTISAAALEEALDSRSIVIQLASNEAIQPEVVEHFESILNLLQRCAKRSLSMESCKEEVFRKVLDLCCNRICARLQSRLWKRPDYLKRSPLTPLGQQLQKTIGPPPSTISQFYRETRNLCFLYNSLENGTTDSSEEGRRMLRDAVQRSHDFCTQYRDDQKLGTKAFRQVNKVGQYWGLCQRLVNASRCHRHLFQDLSLQMLKPYEATSSAPSNSNEKYFVHAEIQLLAHYAVCPDPNTRQPRVIGVSKSACYLCDLFFHHYGRFFISRTHGKLYHLWNVPDIFIGENNREQLLEVRRVLAEMNRELKRILPLERTRIRKRNWPMESDRSLPDGQPGSPIPSDAGTVTSRENLSTITKATVAPRARSPLPPLPASDPSLPPSSSVSNSSIAAVLSPNNPRARTVSSLHSLPNSVASDSLPARTTITSATPIHTTTSNVDLAIEVEEPARGVVELSHAADHEDAAPDLVVDVKAMAPNEEVRIERDGEREKVVVDLQHTDNSRASTRLSMRWK